MNITININEVLRDVLSRFGEIYEKYHDKKLKSEINKYACSPKGKAKLQRKYDQLDRSLTKVENIIGGAAEKLENIKSKIIYLCILIN